MWAQLSFTLSHNSHFSFALLPFLITSCPQRASFTCAELLRVPGEGHIVTSVLTQ